MEKPTFQISEAPPPSSCPHSLFLLHSKSSYKTAYSGFQEGSNPKSRRLREKESHGGRGQREAGVQETAPKTGLCLAAPTHYGGLLNSLRTVFWPAKDRLFTLNKHKGIFSHLKIIIKNNNKINNNKDNPNSDRSRGASNNNKTFDFLVSRTSQAVGNSHISRIIFSAWLSSIFHRSRDRPMAWQIRRMWKAHLLLWSRDGNGYATYRDRSQGCLSILSSYGALKSQRLPVSQGWE